MQVRLDDFIPSIYVDFIEAFFKDKYIEYVLKGGRGGVKSSISMLCGVLNVATGRGNTMVIRRYKNTLRGSVYAEVQKAIDRLGLTDRFESKVSPLEYICKDNGLKINFVGLDDGNKVKSSSVAKKTYTTVIYEECQEMVQSEVISANVTFGRGGTHCNIIYAYNPPSNPNHWVNKELGVKDEEDVDKYILHISYWDIPKDWLGVQFIKMAEKMKAKNPLQYRNVYGGEVVGGVGAVFNNVHYLKEEDKSSVDWSYLARGVDFGWSPDPTTYTVWSYSKKTNSIYLKYAYRGNNLKLKDFSNIIKEENKHNFLIRCDSAEPRSIDTLVENGVNAIACTKGADSIRHGIKWLQDLDGIYIPIEYEDVYLEFVGLTYKQDKYGNPLSSYEGSDHFVDATRYALEEYIKY